MKREFDKERFKKELHQKMKPGVSWWALVGIIFFFFIPEVITYFWGDELKVYFDNIANLQTNDLLKNLYQKTGEMLSENSLLNIAIGVGFVYWWYYERKKLD